MLKVIHRNITPPGSWRDICPETDFPFIADTLDELVTKEMVHLKANKIEVPKDLAERIEHRVCLQMPPGICADPDNKTYVGGRSRHASERIMNATITLANNHVGVSSELAEWRALVCANCKYNVRRVGCLSCRGITVTLKGILAGKSTLSDSRLGVCDIVGAYNKVLCHLNSIDFKKNIPAECWIHKERK